MSALQSIGKTKGTLEGRRIGMVVDGDRIPAPSRGSGVEERRDLDAIPHVRLLPDPLLYAKPAVYRFGTSTPSAAQPCFPHSASRNDQARSESRQT